MIDKSGPPVISSFLFDFFAVFHDAPENEHMFHLWLSDDIPNELFNMAFENDYLMYLMDSDPNSGIFAKFIRNGKLISDRQESCSE